MPSTSERRTQTCPGNSIRPPFRQTESGRSPAQAQKGRVLHTRDLKTIALFMNSNRQGNKGQSKQVSHLRNSIVASRRIAPNVKLGKDVKIFDFVNLYGCEIGDNTKIGTFVEIQKGAIIGRNCKIGDAAVVGPYVFLGDGVTVDTGCQITDSIIDTGTTIGSNVKGTNVILGRENHVEPNLELPTGLITGDELKVNDEYLKGL